MTLLVQQFKFKVDLFVLPMVVANIVMGIQWLKTLGPVTRDYVDLIVELSPKGNWLNGMAIIGWTRAHSVVESSRD